MPKRVKIGPKIVNSVFIGYGVNCKACQFLVHKFDNSEIHVNTIIESDNAELFEQIYPYKMNVSRQVKDLNDHEKNQQKIHYIVRIQGVALAKGNLPLLNHILWKFFLEISLKHLKQ